MNGRAALTLALAAWLQDAPAQWVAPRTSVQCGEPLTLSFVVSHQPGERVEVDFTPLTQDLGWLCDGEPRALAPERDEWDSQTSSRWRVELAALEPGAPRVPAPLVEVIGPDGARRAVTAAELVLEVRGELRPDEDAPRPAKDFRPLGAEPAESSWAWWLGGAAALVATAATWWLARARSRARPQPPPSLAQRLEQLAARERNTPEGVRELYYQLTRVLREELDREQHASRSALTDEEWSVACSATLAPERAAALRDVLARAAEVKYGSAQPTQWAVDEVLGLARAIASTAPTVAALSATAPAAEVRA